MQYEKSKAAFQRSRKSIPGGVNSPVRAFKSVSADPVFIREARGAKLFDIDGNEYIDTIGSWGPMILGHAHPEVVEAIRKQAEKGTSYGAVTELESEMAEQIVAMVPSVGKVRMVNSGTEATMSVLRLARGYTGRDLVVKFAGNYHGHADSFLISAGSGALTFGLPDSPGVPESVAQNTLIAQFNEPETVEALLQAHGDRIAAVMVEPVAGNMGTVPPEPGFLEGLRKLTQQHEVLLIFDEVMTGFRLAPGGAQELYDVTPDLTALGKIIGGGLPVGAFGGRAEIMDYLAPDGPVYQAGTLSGNPLAMVAGLTTLRILDQNRDIYAKLDQAVADLDHAINERVLKMGIAATSNQVGSMYTLFFGQEERVRTFAQSSASNAKAYAAFFREMLDRGIYLPPSQFEALFFSAAHSSGDYEQYLDAATASLEALDKKTLSVNHK